MLLLKDMLSFLGYLRFPTPSFMVLKNFIPLGLEPVSPKEKKEKKRLSNLRWV